MLTELLPEDSALQELLGTSHQRFARLVQEAEAKARPYYARVLGRSASIDEVIHEVFDAVERMGDQAVAHYAGLFDGAKLDPARLRVPASALKEAWDACTPALRSAIQFAIHQIESYQRRLLPRSFGAALDE